MDSEPKTISRLHARFVAKSGILNLKSSVLPNQLTFPGKTTAIYISMKNNVK